jgi:hypothetical protein
MSVITPIVASRDGTRITVDDLIKAPNVIPRRILELAENQFIADAVLRDAGNNDSGVVEFYASTPLFADVGASIRTEFGEYRIVTTSDGIPSVTTSVDRGLSLVVSDEMKRRNKIDRVNQQMTQINNTMRRDWDAAFMALFLGNASVPTYAVATPWATSTTVRQDLLNAEKIVSQAVFPGQPQNFLNFQPDTLIITETSKFNILMSVPFNAATGVYQGNLADESLLYTGKMPQKLLNLDVLVTKSGGPLPDGYAICLERGTVGFISDEESLQATPLYRKQETRSWRCDVNRASAMGLDQPLAAVVLSGV